MGLLGLVQLLFRLVYLLLLARVVMSWVVPRGVDHPVALAIYRLTDPILEPLRRLVPPIGGLDISPILAFLVLGLLERLVVEALVASGLAF